MKRRAERGIGGADVLFNLAMQRIDELQLEGWQSRAIRCGLKGERFR